MKRWFYLIVIGCAVCLTSCTQHRLEDKVIDSSLTTTNATEQTTIATTTATHTEKPAQILKPTLMPEFDAISAMQNGGFATTDGQYDYISDVDGLVGEIVKINRQTKEKEVLLKTAAKSISYYDGWLYFIDYLDNCSIYKMRSDGTELHRLLEGWVNELYFINGQLYFTHIDRGRMVEVMTLNGEILGSAISDESSLIRFDGDVIYYSDGGYALCAFKSNKESVLLTPGKVIGSHTVHGDSVFYQNETDRSIVKMSKNWKDSNVIFKEDTDSLYFGDSKIYAIIKNYDEVHKLSIVQMNYDGTDQKVIYSDDRLIGYKGLILIGDSLYFFIDNPEYVRADLLYSLKEGVLSGPLNERSIKPPDTMKKKP